VTSSYAVILSPMKKVIPSSDYAWKTLPHDRPLDKMLPLFRLEVPLSGAIPRAVAWGRTNGIPIARIAYGTGDNGRQTPSSLARHYRAETWVRVYEDDKGTEK